MSRFVAHKTVIIIAHRLQTVREADKIIVLEAGSIVQKGPFADLVQQIGPFKQLWEEQMQ